MPASAVVILSIMIAGFLWRQAPVDATQSPAAAPLMGLNHDQFMSLGSDSVIGAVNDATLSRDNSNTSELSLSMLRNQVSAPAGRVPVLSSRWGYCFGRVGRPGSCLIRWLGIPKIIRTYADLLWSLLQAHHFVMTGLQNIKCWQPACKHSVPCCRLHQRVPSPASKIRGKVTNIRAMLRLVMSSSQVCRW